MHHLRTRRVLSERKAAGGYGAAASHCAFYPGSVVQVLKKELKDYDTSKGTIRFSADRPLPPALVPLKLDGFKPSSAISKATRDSAIRSSDTGTSAQAGKAPYCEERWLTI